MTVTLTRPPATGGARPGAGGARRRLVPRLDSTPRRLGAVLAALVAAGLLLGVVSFAGVRQRAGLIDGVTTRGGELTVAAQNLYRALSDADATAASAFLAGGVEPAEQRARYQADVTKAASALAVLAAGREGDGGRDDALATISAQLPVYTGLVETARVYNRQGLPLGAAYLREASGLMRSQLLPAAQQLYRSVAADLDRGRDGGAGFPWFAVLLGVATIAGLVWAQRWLTRRTNRVFNIGLLVATAAAVLLILWLGVTALVAGARLEAGRVEGSAQVDRLVEARVAALQARADESLTLVARGAGGDFEEDYVAMMAQLAGNDGDGGLLALTAGQARDPRTGQAARAAGAEAKRWLETHREVRELDDNGSYTEAVKLAVGPGENTTSARFTALDESLADAIAVNGDRFQARSRSAGRALTGVDVGVVLLSALIVLGAALGLQRRIAEYR
ncbi:hypothetical protein [Rhizomonospora bruguierae]|uniref:hypothetical protein n=1 Tax=Rhizomonospora bruguierae TaxID=1581705 RepID=UPI001BD00782|nr:hypothetical protein [Micromonospora sp. NBRC 107566]